MGLLLTFKDWFKPAPPLSPILKGAMDRVCAVVEPTLNTLPYLGKKLGPVLEPTLEYCRHLVADLPGPFVVDRPAFSSSPLIHALFPSTDDIIVTLGKSQSVHEYLETPESKESETFYAMLAARPQRRRNLGMAYDGKVLQSDAIIEYLYFADHVLVELANSLEATQEKLRQRAFDSLLKTFRSGLKAKREERQRLQEARDQERDQINVMRSMGNTAKLEEHQQRLKEIETQLLQNIESLRPERIVDPLVEFLAAPEKALHFEKMTLMLDRCGVITSNDKGVTTGGAEAIDFQQIIGRDRRRYVGLLVRIRRSDVLEAAAQMKGAQQRYLVI